MPTMACSYRVESEIESTKNCLTWPKTVSKRRALVKSGSRTLRPRPITQPPPMRVVPSAVATARVRAFMKKGLRSGVGPRKGRGGLRKVAHHLGRDSSRNRRLLAARINQDDWAGFRMTLLPVQRRKLHEGPVDAIVERSTG